MTATRSFDEHDERVRSIAAGLVHRHPPGETLDEQIERLQLVRDSLTQGIVRAAMDDAIEELESQLPRCERCGSRLAEDDERAEVVDRDALGSFISESVLVHVQCMTERDVIA